MKLHPIFRKKTRTQCGDVFPFLDAAACATRLRVLRCLFANQPGGRCTANAACEPWPKVNESLFFTECVTGFPFPNTLFCRPPQFPYGGFLGVSLSFSASPSKQTLTFTLFQVRILLLGSFHVEDGPLANTSAESGGCLAFLSRQRLCIHHTLQTGALAPGGKLCPIFPIFSSRKICEKNMCFFFLEAFETARPKRKFLKALYMGSILCSLKVGSAVAFRDFEHHNILWFRLGKNISEICNCQNFP